MFMQKITGMIPQPDEYIKISVTKYIIVFMLSDNHIMIKTKNIEIDYMKKITLQTVSKF